MIAALRAAAREGYRTGRGREWHIARYPRTANRSWFSISPMTAPDGEIVGVSVGGPRRCIGIYRLPTKWARL